MCWAGATRPCWTPTKPNASRTRRRSSASAWRPAARWPAWPPTPPTCPPRRPRIPPGGRASRAFRSASSPSVTRSPNPTASTTASPCGAGWPPTTASSHPTAVPWWSSPAPPTATAPSSSAPTAPSPPSRTAHPAGPPSSPRLFLGLILTIRGTGAGSSRKWCDSGPQNGRAPNHPSLVIGWFCGPDSCATRNDPAPVPGMVTISPRTGGRSRRRGWGSGQRGTRWRGRAFRPLMKLLRTRLGSPVSSTRRTRWASAARKVRTSSRAIHWPRHRCGPPPPNVT